MAVGALLAACAPTNELCEGVDAAIVTSYSSDPGCASPVGVCTSGTIASEDLNGTTHFTALSMAPGPSGNDVLYTGELVLTTASGTITLHDDGLLNSATGDYIETEQVVSGTSAYVQRTGMLVSQELATRRGSQVL